MLDVNVGGMDLRLRREAGLFSPGGPDASTMAMLSLIEIQHEVDGYFVFEASKRHAHYAKR